MKTGERVLANVTIMGARRGSGWRYAWYVAKPSTKTGYVFDCYATEGMYPNKANHKWSLEYEARMKKHGYTIVSGRPSRGLNAPEVEE